ncbi:MAG TPA: hypothetical protein VMU53_17085 [Candidatus Sulfotelmatobacter sp.]|nr:hypothetical protein [Candidatus Sulfotelmatobacter sp.]
MKRFVSILLFCLVGVLPIPARKPAEAETFFPFHVGTYWIYKGTVGWQDSENDKETSGDVTWKMTVVKVIRKQGVVGAVVTGYPADLDFSAGTTEPKPWLILENENHQIYLENLGPDYDLAKLSSSDEHGFDKFMVEDNLFFQWPLKQGAKFCDEEAKKREDDMYCWVVEQTGKKKLEGVAGAPSGEQNVFRLQFRTLPDDNTIELAPGIGLLGYEYHHHGTVADTSLQLVEFHPAPEGSEVQGSKP